MYCTQAVPCDPQIYTVQMVTEELSYAVGAECSAADSCSFYPLDACASKNVCTATVQILKISSTYNFIYFTHKVFKGGTFTAFCVKGSYIWKVVDEAPYEASLSYSWLGSSREVRLYRRIPVMR